MTRILAAVFFAGWSGIVFAQTPQQYLDPTSLGLSVSASASTNVTAINNALARSKFVQIPCGTFQINSTILPAQAGQHLRGASQACTTLQLSTNLNGDMIKVLETQAVDVSDLTLDSNNTGLGECIRYRGSAQGKMWNVSCFNIPSNAPFSFEQGDTAGTFSPYGQLGPCYVVNAVGVNSHSVEISESDHVLVHDCTFVNVDNGVNVADSNHVTVSNINVQGNAANASGYAGVRCVNNSTHLTVTNLNVTGTPRGMFLLGCSQSVFSGIKLDNNAQQAILIQAVPTDAPTYFNSLTGIQISSACGGGGCTAAIELNVSGVTADNVPGNILSGIAVIDFAGNITQAIQNDVTPGSNTCVGITANVSIGTC